MRAFIFPGQGSQAVGMGKALAEAFAAAREVFEEVDDALNQRLSRLMWEGPESELTLTENTQPAIMTASIAVLRVLRREGGLDLAKHARLVAGHSLGEYSALCAAGAFTLADTARLLRIRGHAMQDAFAGRRGRHERASRHRDRRRRRGRARKRRRAGIVVVANDNAPGQIVISGAKNAVDKAGEIAKAKGAKRAIPLAVSTPNHSPLLKPAAERCATRWRGDDPSARGAGGLATSRPLKSPNPTRSAVCSSNRSPRACAGAKASGASARSALTMTVEMGGNKVLTGMVKRIDKDLEPVTLDSPADIEAFAKTL